MAEPFVPSNLREFPYNRRSTPLVRRLHGLIRHTSARHDTGIQDNDAEALARAQRLITDPDTRRQLVDKHISIVRQMLLARTPPVVLDENAEVTARAAALSINSTDPGTIANTVLAAATSSLPTDAQAALRQELQSRGIDPSEYHAALARFGAGRYGNIDALMAAYRAARASEASGLDGTGSNTYPGFGGTAFNNPNAAYTYSSANYGLTRGVSDQLYALGVRSSAQVQQVMRDVDHVSSGVSTGLGVTLGEHERRIFRNDTAVPFARLRQVAGRRTDRHLDNTIDYVRTRAQLELEREDAARRGDRAAEERANAALRGLEVHHGSTTAGIATSEEERRRALEARRAAWESYRRMWQNNPQLRAQARDGGDGVVRLSPAERARLEDLGNREADNTRAHVLAGTVADYRITRADDTDSLLGVPTVTPTASPTARPAEPRVDVASTTHTSTSTPTQARVHTAAATQTATPTRRPGGPSATT